MGWLPHTGDTVVDRSGTHFVLTHQIGEGGQGVVYATQAEGAAVKVSTIANALEHRAALEDQITRVARLPLNDLPLAAPRYPLTGPVVGYTMTMLTGMVSLGSLTLELGASFDEDWYRNTGGLRKRLLAVEALAEIIGTLHARGLVYCDLSANNVLVSESPDRGRLFLIDLDNLRPLEDPPKRIFTPHYAAPEQATTGATQATDRFSLAIIAFAVLAAANPFYGNSLDALPPEKYSETPFAALAPWIDDPDDTSNRWSHALPRQLTISPMLARIFLPAFTSGRQDSEQRPAAAQFAIAARRARYAVARCPGCGWDNYVSRVDCASCGRPGAPDRLQIHVAAGPTLEVHELCPIVVLPHEGIAEINASALGLTEPPHVAGLRLTRDGSGWIVEVLHDRLTIDAPTAQRSFPLKSDNALVLGRPHRAPLVIRLALAREPQ